MTPDLAQPLVLDWEVRRATMEPSPVRVWLANWNWSSEAQTSVPAPVRV
jgi:hypothetical protein